MAFVELDGEGFYIPKIAGIAVTPTVAANSMVMLGANAGDYLMVSGRIQFAEKTGTKTITKVHFLMGTVIKTNGSNVRVSFQDIDLSGSPPSRPDGIADQQYTILNADANFASNTWYTATMDTGRVVAHGENFAVLFEWDSPVTGDQFSINGFTLASNTSNSGQTSAQGGSCQTGTSVNRALRNQTPNVLFEFSDGTFGVFISSQIVKGLVSNSYNLNSTPDEYCLEFMLPFRCKVDALYGIFTVSNNGSNCELVLYQGTTVLSSVEMDGNMQPTTGTARVHVMPLPSQITLEANTLYRVSLKPTSANSVIVYGFSVNDVAHLSTQPLGQGAQLNSRTDLGAWGTPVETSRLFLGVRVSAIDTGATANLLRGKI